MRSRAFLHNGVCVIERMKHILLPSPYTGNPPTMRTIMNRMTVDDMIKLDKTELDSDDEISLHTPDDASIPASPVCPGAPARPFRRTQRYDRYYFDSEMLDFPKSQIARDMTNMKRVTWWEHIKGPDGVGVNALMRALAIEYPIPDEAASCLGKRYLLMQTQTIILVPDIDYHYHFLYFMKFDENSNQWRHMDLCSTSPHKNIPQATADTYWNSAEMLLKYEQAIQTRSMRSFLNHYHECARQVGSHPLMHDRGTEDIKILLTNLTDICTKLCEGTEMGGVELLSDRSDEALSYLSTIYREIDPHSILLEGADKPTKFLYVTTDTPRIWQRRWARLLSMHN